MGKHTQVWFGSSKMIIFLPILTLKKEEKRYCPSLSVLPQDMREADDEVPESRWSMVMEFHLLVMSM